MPDKPSETWIRIYYAELRLNELSEEIKSDETEITIERATEVFDEIGYLIDSCLNVKSLTSDIMNAASEVRNKLEIIQARAWRVVL